MTTTKADDYLDKTINEFKEIRKLAHQRSKICSNSSRVSLQSNLIMAETNLANEFEVLISIIKRTIQLDDALFLFTRQRRKQCLEMLDYLCTQTKLTGVRKFPVFNKQKLQEFLDFCKEISTQTGIPPRSEHRGLFIHTPLGLIYRISLKAETDWDTQPKRKESFHHLVQVRKAIQDSLILQPSDIMMVLAMPFCLQTKCRRSKLRVLSLDLIKAVYAHIK